MCVCVYKPGGRHAKIADIVCRLKMAFIPITRLGRRRCPADESFITVSACERRAPAACVYVAVSQLEHTWTCQKHVTHSLLQTSSATRRRGLVGFDSLECCCCWLVPSRAAVQIHTELRRLTISAQTISEHVCFRVESHIKRSVFTLV